MPFVRTGVPWPRLGLVAGAPPKLALAAEAAALVRTIYGAPALLLALPHRGRPGKKAETRELVMPSLPYVIVYTVRDDVVFVVRILHGAQQWP